MSKRNFNIFYRFFYFPRLHGGDHFFDKLLTTLSFILLQIQELALASIIK